MEIIMKDIEKMIKVDYFHRYFINNLCLIQLKGMESMLI